MISRTSSISGLFSRRFFPVGYKARGFSSGVYFVVFISVLRHRLQSRWFKFIPVCDYELAPYLNRIDSPEISNWFLEGQSRAPQFLDLTEVYYA